MIATLDFPVSVLAIACYCNRRSGELVMAYRDGDTFSIFDEYGDDWIMTIEEFHAAYRATGL